MIASLLLLSLLAAEPSGDRLALLQTFRQEFVAIPAHGELSAAATLPRTSGLLAVARYEVPQNLWQAVMGSNPSRWKGPRNSVEMVSLDEARDFCLRVTHALRSANLITSKQEVRLPTEAEWELMARGGTTTKYFFGDDASRLGEFAWFHGNAAGNDPAVGAKQPNPWGLYDVHGYLWEWTDDSAAEAGRQKKAVVRGGSWKNPADQLTSSSRQLVEPTLRDDAVGLRPVLAHVAVTTTAAAFQAAEPEKQATAQGKIVPAGAKLERLWGEGEFTEGPALAPHGSILFSDIGQSIYRYDPKTKKTDLFRRPSGRSNGLMFNQRGELIACEGANTGGNRRISITTGIDGAKDGTVRTLADRYEGKRFNSPNDLAIDARGNVYFTDPRYVGDDPRELDFEAVFLVAPDGTVKIATRDVQKPNGILVSADGKTVYVSDNNPQGNRHLAAFDVKSDGTLDSKRVLHDFGTGRGIDGMTLDRAGNIYATAGTRDKAGVYVFDAAGKQLAMIPTPGDPTNCVFGAGDAPATLYVTCANSHDMGTKYGLYAIRLNAAGYHVVKPR